MSRLDGRVPAQPTSRLWHVVICKPRQESVAAENLLRQGFDVYFPQLQTQQRRQGSWVESIQPLFPRYLFVHVDAALQSTAPIRSTRGALGLVRFGAEPAVVPAAVIAAIRSREAAVSGLHADPARNFHGGDRICIQEGPLAGLDGIFASDDGDARVVILLELLGKTNRVKVSRAAIAKAA